MLRASQSSSHDLRHSAWHHLRGSRGSLSGLSPVALARGAPSAATVAAGDTGEVTAPRVDGDSVTAEDAANGSGGGGSHSGVLREGAEDGARKNHHHRRGLDDNRGRLALPDTGLIAAVGQRGWAAGLARLAGLAWPALVGAGHVSGLAVHLGERAGRKQSTRTPEEQPATPPKGSQDTCRVGRLRACRREQGLVCLSPAGSFG